MISISFMSKEECIVEKMNWESVTTIVLIAMGDDSWIHAFPEGISVMWNTVSSRIWTRVTVSIS